jgi:hypothetical protein
VSQDRRPSGRARGRAARAAAALLLSLGLMGSAAACGFDAQLLKPYNPADGTNIDVGEDGALKVRNLQVVSRAKGEGYISATLVSTAADRLTGITVAPQTLEGTAGAPVQATLAAPIELGGPIVVMTDTQPLVTVSSPEIVAGGSAGIVMTFEKAGQVSLNAPIVDGTVPPWSTISPSPTPSASPTPGASPTS